MLKSWIDNTIVIFETNNKLILNVVDEIRNFYIEIVVAQAQFFINQIYVLHYYARSMLIVYTRNVFEK